MEKFSTDQKFCMKPVGYVTNNHNFSCHPETIKTNPSALHIFKEYTEALCGLSISCYIEVIYLMDKEDKIELSGRARSGNTKGVFASRSPYRPNHIGISTVKIKEIKENIIIVEGLDALNGSPIIDIKSGADTFSIYTDNNIQFNEPRTEVIAQIMASDIKKLLYATARFHGHVCPGLTMGILSSSHIMKKIINNNDFPQKTIVGMNSCLTDGIQYVTGCTIGNKKLEIDEDNDFLISVITESGKNYIVSLNSNAEEKLNKLSVIADIAERSIALTKIDPETIFTLKCL